MVAAAMNACLCAATKCRTVSASCTASWPSCLTVATVCSQSLERPKKPRLLQPNCPVGSVALTRVVPRIGVGLAGLVDVGVDGQELARGRIVVTVN
jgi:hypothetical protein